MKYLPLAFAPALVFSTASLPPVYAQETAFNDACPAGTTAQPLPLVGGDGSEVEKTPQNPSLPVLGIPGLRIRDNFNTDWEIPGGTIYEQFTIVVIPEESDDYDVEVNLKYGDDTSDRLYNEGDIELVQDEPIVINVEPRRSLHPYQVNVRIGDESIGNRYRATAIGCRRAQSPLVNSGQCIPLIVVGGDDDQTTVEKKVSAINIPGPFGLGIRNNWNTDWIVPLPERFSRFIGVVESIDEEADEFDIGLSLKYADDSADEVFNEPRRVLSPGENVEIVANPQRDEIVPYQVNVYVGGIDNSGTRYRASVVGCY